MKKVISLEKWKFEYQGKRYPATVPGDIVNDLMQNDIIDDVFYSDNYKQIAWVHERDWSYECEFFIDREISREEDARLTFLGIDTFSEIYLNGIHIGKTENMFLRYDFLVRPYIKAGKNVLKVQLCSIRKVLDSFSEKKYFACFHDKRIFVRKAQCHFGWDWAPDFPGTGIFDKVILAIEETPKIKNVQIDADINGIVSAVVEVENCAAFENISMKVEVADAQGQIGSETLLIEGAKTMINVRVNDPKLWYPNGYGDQPIYSYSVQLQKNGRITDVFTGKFAFRKLEVRETPYGADKKTFKFYVNGLPIKIVGSNWIPASILTGCVGESKYRSLLTCAKGAGFNMLRVWGGGIYEKEIFYDICDEEGILIWQDFMFACGDIPDDCSAFCKQVEQEARYQITRLRNHPCIALWCGGNELPGAFAVSDKLYGHYITRILLPGLCADLDLGRRYICGSPYSIAGIGDDAKSGDCHRNALAFALRDGKIENFREYLWDNNGQFISECAVMGMCRLKSFYKYMPPEHRWPTDALWEDRMSCNPYDDTVSSFTERMKMTVGALFGSATDLEDFTKKSMLAHAELLRAELNYARSRSECGGFLNWMFNDTWGTGTWSLIDYYGEKKPSYFAMKRSAKRRNIFFVLLRDGVYLVAVNDQADVFSEQVVISQCAVEGKVLFSKIIKLAVPAFGIASYKIEYNGAEKKGYLYAKAGELDDVYFYDLWKNIEFRSDLQIVSWNSEKEAEGYCITVEIKAYSFARAVFLDVAGSELADFSDNYFDLPAGENKKIIIHTPLALDKKDMTIKTFADVWDT